jgi:hypothetical protein
MYIGKEVKGKEGKWKEGKRKREERITLFFLGELLQPLEHDIPPLLLLRLVCERR